MGSGRLVAPAAPAPDRGPGQQQQQQQRQPLSLPETAPALISHASERSAPVPRFCWLRSPARLFETPFTHKPNGNPAWHRGPLGSMMSVVAPPSETTRRRIGTRIGRRETENIAAATMSRDRPCDIQAQTTGAIEARHRILGRRYLPSTPIRRPLTTPPAGREVPSPTMVPVASRLPRAPCQAVQQSRGQVLPRLRALLRRCPFRNQKTPVSNLRSILCTD